LKAIGVISALVTFVVLVPSPNITTDIFSGRNTDSQNVAYSQQDTKTVETESSESLTLEGLSPRRK
jgi:hypothetical protein